MTENTEGKRETSIDTYVTIEQKLTENKYYKGVVSPPFDFSERVKSKHHCLKLDKNVVGINELKHSIKSEHGSVINVQAEETRNEIYSTILPMSKVKYRSELKGNYSAKLEKALLSQEDTLINVELPVFKKEKRNCNNIFLDFRTWNQKRLRISTDSTAFQIKDKRLDPIVLLNRLSLHKSQLDIVHTNPPVSTFLATDDSKTRDIGDNTSCLPITRYDNKCIFSKFLSYILMGGL